MTEVYLTLIEKTIMEIMKEISDKYNYILRTKLRRIIEEEIPKQQKKIQALRHIPNQYTTEE